MIAQLKTWPRGILVNEAHVTTRHTLKKGERLTTTIIEEASSENIVPAPLPLRIVYEDRDLMVIHKAAGVPVHPSQNHYDHTLANGLAWYFMQQGRPYICRIINRLDRDTSGLLIVAKHRLSAGILSGMVREHRIHREYLAIAEGQLPARGSICLPIARVPGSTIERQVNLTAGEYALTHFQVLGRTDCLSLVCLRLETGRTHQIRVHLSTVGHPLFGDFIYHPACRRELSENSSDSLSFQSHGWNSSRYSLLSRQIKRQALHSWRLSFHHPITGKLLYFISDMPEDMANLLPISLTEEVRQLPFSPASFFSFLRQPEPFSQ